MQRIRSNQKPRSNKCKSAKPEASFDQPHLLEGEDPAVYQELLAGSRAAVNPGDAIDEILANDSVSQEWENRRCRRLITGLLRDCQRQALQRFLKGKLDRGVYSDVFAEYLSDELREHLPEDQGDVVPTLVEKYVGNDPDAIGKVNAILDGKVMNAARILDLARTIKEREIAQEFFQKKRSATSLVRKLLAEAATSLDALLAHTLLASTANPDPHGGYAAPDYLGFIERLDRLATAAQRRRDACLLEIDRRRASLRQVLRRSGPEIEGMDYKRIENGPAEGEK
jgi:hypothetical protein